MIGTSLTFIQKKEPILKPDWIFIFITTILDLYERIFKTGRISFV